MKFKFRTSDLFVVTACVGAIVAAYQIDLILFRKLFLLSLVAVFSLVTVSVRPVMKRIRLLGAVAGWLAGVVYLAIVVLSPYLIFEDLDGWNFKWLPPPPIFGETTALVVISVFVGSVLGPMMAFYFQVHDLPEHFRKSFWISVAILGGILLVLFFAMADRQSFHSRDWTLFQPVLIFTFLFQGWSWIGRFEQTQSGDLSPNSQQPDATG
ncbi:MAG: hypothetical protein AB8B55_04815 [Mariniblastus sp.]